MMNMNQAALYSLAFCGVGLLFIALSIPLIQERVPPNSFYGFRTAKSLSDPKIWYAINRLSGIDLLLAGVLISLGSVAMLFRVKVYNHGISSSSSSADGIHVFRCFLAWVYHAEEKVDCSIETCISPQLAVAGLWQE